MAYDDEDFLGEEFDFVDEDDAEDTVDEKDESTSESADKEKRRPRRSKAAASDSDSDDSDSDKADAADKNDGESDQEEAKKEPEPVGPPADHVVHVYECGQFKRTIQREFTAEDAEVFATEYNRTGKSYSRTAQVAVRDSDPAAQS